MGRDPGEIVTMASAGEPGGVMRGSMRLREKPAEYTPARRSASQAETCDHVLITLGCVGLEIVEQLAALVHHFQQAAA